jgi:mRNA interferase RelE/StbE
MARMRYEIVLAPAAAQSFKDLKADPRARVRDALETHLRHEPTKVSKSRIKRLRGMSRPQYRLRVDDIRVFYDVTDKAVEILAIIAKAEAEAWLAKEGTPESGGGASEGEG